MTPEPTYVYRATLFKVTDGDTYVLMVKLGFYSYQAVKVRLHGIDVYEKNTAPGKAAIIYVEALLRDKEVTVQSYKDQRSFERWVCDVWVDGIHLKDLLREAGFEKATT